MKKTIIMGGICCALLATAHAQTTPAQKQKQPTRSYSTYSARSFLNVEEDSSVSPPQTTIVYKNGSLYHIRMTDDKVVDLSVDDRKISGDSFYVYDALIKKLTLQIKADRVQAKVDKEQAERDELQADRDREQAEKDEIQAGHDREQADRDRRQAKLDAEQAERDALDAERENQRAMEDKRQAEKDREQAGHDREQSDRDREQAVTDREQAVKDRAQADRDRAQSVEDRKQAERDREQAARDRKQADEDRATMQKMIGELVKEGIIADKKNLRSLTLDEDGFIINGKQQSDALHKKFMEKYLKRPGGRISFYNDSGQPVR